MEQIIGDAVLSAYVELFGRVERKLFAEVAAGQSSASLKSEYLKRCGIPARMFNGGGFHFLEYERTSRTELIERKLVPYQKMAQLGRPLPALLVCDSPETEENYLSLAGCLHLLATTMERAMAGLLTGAATVCAVPPPGRWNCTASCGSDEAGEAQATGNRIGTRRREWKATPPSAPPQ